MRTILGWPFRFEVGESMRSFIFIAALCTALNGYPALADEAASPQRTRIEIDQAAKTFTFIIDNKPVVMLDGAGLHVIGEINYGATLSDTGPDQIKQRIASQAEVADD